MGALVGPQRRDLFAEQENIALVDGQVARDQVEERGLAGAVGADDQAALAGLDGQRDAVDRRQATEGLVQVRDLKRSHSLFAPGTTPSGMNTTIATKTKPSSMFQRSI